MQNTFHHHDRIIHHHPDRKDQRKERQRIDAEAQHHQDPKCPQERHRNGNGRHQRGAPILQEEVTDKNGQHDGDDQGDRNLLDRLAHEVRRIVGEQNLHVRWHLRIHADQLCAHLIDRLERIRAWLPRQAHPHGGHPVVGRAGQVAVRAQLHPRHITQAQHRSVRTSPHDDVCKLLHIVEPSLGLQGVDHLSRTISRHAAHRSQRGLHVLLANRVHHLIHAQTQRRNPVGVQPDPHAVLGGEQIGGADTA